VIARIAGVGAVSVAGPVDRRFPRCVSFALEAARQAVEAAGGRPEGRGAIVLATMHGGAGFCQEFHEGFSSPLLFSASVHNATASVLSERYQVHGPVHTLLTGRRGCEEALEVAWGIVSDGLADWALAGAFDELNEAILAGYKSLGHEGKPAEGAAMFVVTRGGRPLERMPRPRVRIDGRDVDPLFVGEAFSVTEGLVLAATWEAKSASSPVGDEWLPVWGDRPV